MRRLIIWFLFLADITRGQSKTKFQGPKDEFQAPKRGLSGSLKKFNNLLKSSNTTLESFFKTVRYKKKPVLRIWSIFFRIRGSGLEKLNPVSYNILFPTG